jgi:hypothetical protein
MIMTEKQGFSVTMLIWLALFCLAVFLFLARGRCQAAPLDQERLAAELAQAEIDVVGTGARHGVDYVEVAIPEGYSISTLCRRVPSLNRRFATARERIAYFNALHHSYIKTADWEPNGIEADTLKIPLDLEAQLEIFAPEDESLASHPLYILIDVGKGYLGLYERGKLTRVFPISAGISRRTPLIAFKVEQKFENHWSTHYGGWMPWSLLIRRPYYIHGGALPGANDSAGCIRMFVDDAEKLYHLVSRGTPGRIIRSGDQERAAAPPAPELTSFPWREE